MVKGSGSVGMWSTCKVVHHVHAVGALVHQAEQAHPLHARLRGGYGGAWPGGVLPSVALGLSVRAAPALPKAAPRFIP